jgi:hypothetical protein
MSLVAEYHAARKERLARISARAIVKPSVIGPAPRSESAVVAFKIQPYSHDAGWDSMWFWDLVCLKPSPVGRPKIADIQFVVADFYGLYVHDLVSSRRTANVVRPRQVAVYLCKQMTLHSLPVIGRMFGGRDHTTALHSVRKISELRKIDKQLDSDIRTIASNLGGYA